MKEAAWNNVIWIAIKSLACLHENENREACIDEVFFACEKDLYSLKAPEREAQLRLFALALYCDKTFKADFFKSMAFLRYSMALDFVHFKRTAKALIEENNFALVVFWTIFRLSFGNSTPRSSYLPLEKEMRNKALELGIKSAAAKTSSLNKTRFRQKTYIPR